MPSSLAFLHAVRRGGDGDRLPCGAAAEELLDQVAEGTPPRAPAHQRTCPHCRAAVAELELLWAPVQSLAAENIRAPGGLLQEVMTQVRELSRNAWYAVLPGPTGTTRIAARVVGALARLAAESVPQVSLAYGGGRGAAAAAAEEWAADVGVAGTHVVVDVQVAVDFGASIPAVAEQVRAQIVRHLSDQTGLTTTEVNVSVVDVR